MVPELVYGATLIFCSAGACAVAVLVAKWTRIDRAMLRFMAPRRAPEEAIDQLAAFADTALRHGLIAVEPAAPAIGLPLLERGVGLLIDGATTPEVRRTLEQSLDSGVFRRGGRVAGGVLALACLATLSVSVVSSIGLAVSGPAGAGDWLASAAAIPAGLGLVGLSMVETRRVGSAARKLLEGLLAIETVCMISGRRDGASVRAHLRRLLPGHGEGQVSAAA